MIEEPLFHNNDEALMAGFELAKQLFKRLTRVHTSEDPEPEDEFINKKLDLWLEQVLKSHSVKNYIPFADLVLTDAMTQDEVYIVLVLLALSLDPSLKEACGTLRGNTLLKSPTRSLLMDLLYPGDIHKISFYHLGQQPIVFENKRYIYFKYNTTLFSDEPDVFLTPTCIKRLLALSQFNEVPREYCGFYYQLEMPTTSWKDFVFDADQKSELLQLCREYQKSAHNTPLHFVAMGAPGLGKHTFARSLASQLKMQLCTLNIAELIARANDASTARLVLNEISSLNAILFIPNIHDLLQYAPVIRHTILDSLRDYSGISILTVPSFRDVSPDLSVLVTKTIDFFKPSHSERISLWRTRLNTHALPSGTIERLSSNYLFTGAQIEHAYRVFSLLSHQIDSPAEQTLKNSAHKLEKACDFVLHKTFEGLTVSTKSDVARLDRLVLPPNQERVFADILAAARNHDKVMIDWGFGQRLVTGRGICVLFDGPPGTGKTFAAEVLANELHRPLERVHLPNLVSKWIGETGENLSKLFTSATANNAILLLDEADALLSKRVSNTSKSTDRYANMEINILLQELERFNGLSILTTNLEKSLDEALERRIQFRITFANPGFEERERLWHTLMSPKALVQPPIDYKKLARAYELSGGHIKNAILNAAYRACTDDRGISEQDLARAAADECSKQGLLIQRE